MLLLKQLHGSDNAEHELVKECQERIDIQDGREGNARGVHASLEKNSNFVGRVGSSTPSDRQR